MRRAISTALILAALLTACSGSKSVALGWETHHVDDGGFSIAVPAAWHRIQKLDPKGFDEFAADNPQFAPFKEIIASGLIKFFAHDPDIADDFATSVSVVVHSLGTTPSLSEYARESAALIRRLHGVDVRTSVVRLPAGRCLRMTYENQVQLSDRLQWHAVLQYGFLHGGSEYVITFTTLSSLRGRYRTTFAKSARSFRID